MGNFQCKLYIIKWLHRQVAGDWLILNNYSGLSLWWEVIYPQNNGLPSRHLSLP